MNGETALKLIKALKTAKTVLPITVIALGVGFLLLVATGVIQPTGDELPHDDLGF